MPLIPSAFTFDAPVQLLAVISSVGPTTGGNLVRLIGDEFRYGATVTFAGANATAITVVDANHITCIVPAHAAGSVDVIVTNTSGISPSATLTNGYTYVVAAPTVTAILPTTGSTGGGEPVVITGTGFVATPTVHFGGSSATAVIFVSSTQITCLTPAHSAATVDVTVTNPDTQIGVLFSSFTFLTTSPFVDTGGWWFSDEDFGGGTDVIVSPSTPKHPRTWAKLSPFATSGALALGGSPAASCIFHNHIIYAGDDYTLSTDQPPLRIFDGIADRVTTNLPNTVAGAIPRAILSLLLNDGIVYLTSIDSGTTSSNFAGRVFTFDPLSQTLGQIGSGFASGEVPYALAWHMDRLWVGTNKSSGAGGKVYWIRPEIDTDWTTDYTLSTSSAGGVCSMLSFNGKLYVGTDNAAAAFGLVLARDTDGTYSTADTGSGGTARVNNGFYSLIQFGTNLYATYWNADTPVIAKVRKFDGTTWTTAYTGSLLTLRPYMLTFIADNFLYVAGGGVGKRASLIRTADGTTWSDLTAYLAGPTTETALPMYGVLGI